MRAIAPFLLSSFTTSTFSLFPYSTHLVSIRQRATFPICPSQQHNSSDSARTKVHRCATAKSCRLHSFGASNRSELSDARPFTVIQARAPLRLLIRACAASMSLYCLEASARTMICCSLRLVGI